MLAVNLAWGRKGSDLWTGVAEYAGEQAAYGAVGGAGAAFAPAQAAAAARVATMTGRIGMVDTTAGAGTGYGFHPEASESEQLSSRLYNTGNSRIIYRVSSTDSLASSDTAASVESTVFEDPAYAGVGSFLDEGPSTPVSPIPNRGPAAGFENASVTPSTAFSWSTTILNGWLPVMA
jgi:hypothetical protein